MIQRIVSFALFCAVVFLAGVSNADFNFSGTVSSPIEITNVSGLSQIRFTVTVRNSGSTDYAGNFRIKPLVLPNNDEPAWSDSNDGIVLKHQTSVVRIPAGGSTDIVYTQILPLMPRHEYLMAVHFNSDSAIRETNEVDNVTSDLVSLGHVAVTSAEPLPQATLDLYAEVPDAVRAYYGGAQHSLRMIKRGPGDFVGSLGHEALWARFLMADLINKKVYTLPYQQGGVVEKNWYAISWHSEFDRDGNSTVVDYYSQGPDISAVPPGKYKFLTLTNSHDIIPETNPYNNLDARPFVLRSFQGNDTHSGEIWITKKIADRQLQPINLVYQIPYRPQTDVSWSLQGLPSWLTTTTQVGTVGARSDLATLIFHPEVSSLAVGDYSTEIALGNNLHSQAAVRIPARLFVHGPSEPVMNLSAVNLSFSGTQRRYPSSQTLTIRNTGTAALEFKVAVSASSEWLSVSPSTGVVAPGQSQPVVVEAHPDGMAPRGRSGGVLRILSNSTNSHPTIPVTLDYSVQ